MPPKSTRCAPDFTLTDYGSLGHPKIVWRSYPPPPDELYELAEDCSFVLGDLIITARKGTVTDGASIPRFFWRLIGAPINSTFFPAAVFHDAAYEGTLQWIENGCLMDVTREMADDMFDQLLRLPEMAVSAWRRNLMVWAVRKFGQAAWDKNR